MDKSKVQFASKLGLLLATLGSAVGLGSVWRFPAEVQTNGGGAFLLIFILCTIVLGIPVMLAEFAIGRAGRGDTVSSLEKLGGKKLGWSVGGLALLAGLLILSFYIVVCGWTFEYFCASISGDLFSGFDANSAEADIKSALTRKMDFMVHSTWMPLIATFLMLATTIGIVAGGVRGGIERLSKLLMPALFIILALFVVVAAMTPGALDGYRYFLEPDFSKISADTVLAALGQAFFSLSLGMGLLITYGSYFPKTTNMCSTAVSVALLGLLVAVMMGMIIFPLVLTFGHGDADVQGTTLIFMTMPELFVYLPMSQLWSILFFFLLLVAAITSCVSVAEALVALAIKRLKMERITACLLVLAILTPLSALCSLSQMTDTSFTVGGITVFDLFNNFATNYMLPLGSAALCVWLGWFAPKDLFREQLTNKGTLRIWYFGFIRFSLRFIAPILIMYIFIKSII
ncbi:MAG: sodium-dependent transporter [Muribaculaceae bacterium]|nr:sodium-dependent transporter [Muribaculaceae bacterium]